MCSPSPAPSVVDRGGGAEGAMPPPSPVKISHKKDGHQRGPHSFHVSRPPPYPEMDPLLPVHAPVQAYTCPICLCVPPTCPIRPQHAPLHIWYQSHNLKCFYFIVQVKFTLSHSPSIVNYANFVCQGG